MNNTEKKEDQLTLKSKLYNQCVLTTVTYGSKTWNTTLKQTQQLRSMQRAQEHIMLNIFVQ